MAPRILGGDSWGQSSGVGLPLVAVIAVATLVLGGLAGYAFGNKNNNTASTGRSVSQIAGTTFQDMVNGDPSQAGAVKAATSFISALPEVSILPDTNRTQATSVVFASNAPEEARSFVTYSLANLGKELRPTSSAATSRAVTLPGVYKVARADNGYTVTIWYCLMVADPQGAKFRSVWQTADVTLVYENGWRVSGFRNAFGPSPALLSPQGQSGDYNAAQPLLDRSFAFRYGPVPAK